MSQDETARRKLASSGVEAAVQLLTLAPGLYSVTFISAQSVRGDAGLRLPCVRIDPVLPGPAAPSLAQVGIVGDVGMLSGPADLAFIRVQDAKASVMVTTYRVSGEQTAPELKFTQIDRFAPPPAPASEAATAPAAAPAPVQALPGATLLAHVAEVGDVVVALGQWAGRTGSERGIEAMCIDGGSLLPAEEIEYQAILGWNWNTPWFQGGQLCGSRGIALPLLGFRVRLLGESARRYAIVYEARLLGGVMTGPVADGAACGDGTASLEAIRVDVVARDR